jgi:DNA-binding transcriptional regulator YiaG
MNRQKLPRFRNSVDLSDKVQVKALRKHLDLSEEQFARIVRKSGNSISAITKEATTSKRTAVTPA